MPKLSDKELLRITNEAIIRFHGNSQELKGAIGTLHIGQHYGWKVIYFMSDKKTLRKYEDILQVKFRDVMDEVGEQTPKSIAWKAWQKYEGLKKNFWKAVSGEIKGIRSPDIGEK